MLPPGVQPHAAVARRHTRGVPKRDHHHQPSIGLLPAVGQLRLRQRLAVLAAELCEDAHGDHASGAAVLLGLGAEVQAHHLQKFRQHRLKDGLEDVGAQILDPLLKLLEARVHELRVGGAKRDADVAEEHGEVCGAHVRSSQAVEVLGGQLEAHLDVHLNNKFVLRAT